MTKNIADTAPEFIRDKENPFAISKPPASVRGQSKIQNPKSKIDMTDLQLEKLRQVNLYLSTTTRLAPDRGGEHLVRLDNILDLDNTATHSNPETATTSLLAEAKAAGIPINSSLEMLVLNSPPEVVLNAIAVARKNMRNGLVRNPAGLFRRAIENRWKP